MTAIGPAASSAPASARSGWWYLKIAAICALVLANMLYFGGNAALDLLQVLGPGTSFTGTVTNYQHTVIEGEQTDEYNVIQIQSNRGVLRWDVPVAIYNAADVGVAASGVYDSWSFPGHDQALRELTISGQPPLDSNTENRILGQALILFVVLLVGGMVFSGIWHGVRGPRRRRGLRPAGPAPATEA